MSFYDRLELSFWDALETDITCEEEAQYFEQALRILELDPEQGEKELESDSELRKTLRLDILEESSEESTKGFISDSEEENSILENSKMNKNEETVFPKQEIGESSQQGFERNKKRKSNSKQPIFPTKPKIASGIDTDILNIDCQENRRDLIDKWIGEIGLIVQTNPDAYDTARKVLALADHKSIGIAKSFIKSTYWDDSVEPEKMVETILESFYTIFLGINYTRDRQIEQEKEKENAKKRLTNLQLCDICYLNDFNCDFEKNLHLIDQNDWPEFVKMYFLKVPIIGDSAYKRFELEKKPPLGFSLGYAKKLVKEEISKLCDLSRKQRKIKKFNKKCCKELSELPTEYGCKISYKPKKKKFYKKKFSKYRIIKKRKKFSPGKYFKPKSFPKKDKAKFCPKGKKNCRCWICNIEGHYANECPNRQNSEKIKLLEYADNNGLEPIEEVYEEYSEVFIIIKEEPPDESDETSDESSLSEDSD